MACDIGTLTLDDLPELSRFLSAGFRVPSDAAFVTPDVLRWKYLESAGGESVVARGKVGDRTGLGLDSEACTSIDAARSYIARDETGRIVGHLGVSRTAFEGQAIASTGGSVSTLHVIDWLGSPSHRSIGVRLLRVAHQGVTTGFALGTTQVALKVGQGFGYDVRAVVPVYTRVLRARYGLRAGRSGLVDIGLRLVRDAANWVGRHPAPPRTSIALARAPAFGQEIVPIVAEAKAHAVLTSRDSVRLNAFLRFPGQAFSGWHLLDDTGRLRGFALLNLVPKDEGRTRIGKIVDCVVAGTDGALWHSAALALTRELHRQGADLAQAYASNEWTAEALRQSGYVTRFAVKLVVYDPQERIPPDATFHLTSLEGDYAYT
jgi:hypothetical protein